MTIDFHKPFVVDKNFNRSLLKKEREGWYTGKYVRGEPLLEMSYGGYNTFRKELSLSLLGETLEDVWEECVKLKTKKYPLGIYHLLNFADNEGYMGPTAIAEIQEFLKLTNLKMRPMDEFNKLWLTNFKKIRFAKNEYLYFS